MALSKAERLRRAKLIQKKLKSLFPHPQSPLDHTDAFTLLIAVVLSAQTTDVMVNQVTPGLFEIAGTPEKMAKLSVEEILSEIKRVNFAPTKAKNLKKLAEKLVSEFAGKVPKTFEELESLAGVGHKSAGVVMSQMYGLPAFPVDTHIHRLAKRWKLSSGKSVEQTEADLKEVFPEKDWHDVHLQIIFFGRTECTARTCDGKICVICQKLNSA